MKSLIHAIAAGSLALALTACGSDTPEVKTADAEDYTAGASTVVGKWVDAEKKTKTKDGCLARYTSGSRKGQCKTWKYKTTVTDDTDYVLKLGNGWEVDVDRDVYDSYDLTDADKAADVFPRT